MPRYIFYFTVCSLVFAVQKARPAELFIPWDVYSVEMHQVADTYTPEVLTDNNCSHSNTPLSLTDIGWSEVITIGQKVWQIVEANKPVVNVQTPVVSALPGGVTCWSEMENWQAPKVQSYEVVYKNYFGMEVVKFRFRLQYTYGGGIGGRGQYLANVTVMPAELNVIWGYTFKADVEVEQAVNLGTLAKPMAGLELNLKWTVSTVLKQSDNSFHFFVQGDGVSTSAN